MMIGRQMCIFNKEYIPYQTFTSIYYNDKESINADKLILERSV